MATLNLKIEIPDEDFNQSLSYLNGNPEIVEKVKQDYFSAELIEIDIKAIEDNNIRFYHTNGIVAAIINLTNASNQ